MEMIDYKEEMLMSDIYGYARVSTREQNEDRQLKALLDVDVPKENIFVDKESGKDFNRVCYRRLVRRLRKDDVLYIKSIDRLGRNYEEIIEQWKYITKTRKADIVVIDMPILDTRQGKDLMGTFLSDIVLALLSYVSENERINIKQRQAEGIAIAKANGVQFGRKPTPLPNDFEIIVSRWRHKEITVTEASELCGMPKSTFFDKAKKYEYALAK